MLFAMIFDLKAQSYSLQLPNNDLNCTFDFFPNKTYLIKLSYNNAADFMVSQIFSFGNYMITNRGDYELTDSTHGYTMTLERISDNHVLLVKSGFQWMQMNYLVKTNDKSSSPDNILDNFLTSQQLCNYREKLKREWGDKNNRLSTGLYRSGFNENFTFEAKENGTYSIKYYSLELSKGTWEKEGNLLKIKDSNIDSHFYILIDSSGKLQSLLIPGDFSLTKFSKTK